MERGTEGERGEGKSEKLLGMRPQCLCLCPVPFARFARERHPKAFVGPEAFKGTGSKRIMTCGLIPTLRALPLQR